MASIIKSSKEEQVSLQVRLTKMLSNIYRPWGGMRTAQLEWQEPVLLTSQKSQFFACHVVFFNAFAHFV